MSMADGGVCGSLLHLGVLGSGGDVTSPLLLEKIMRALPVNVPLANLAPLLAVSPQIRLAMCRHATPDVIDISLLHHHPFAWPYAEATLAFWDGDGGSSAPEQQQVHWFVAYLSIDASSSLARKNAGTQREDAVCRRLALYAGGAVARAFDCPENSFSAGDEYSFARSSAFARECFPLVDSWISVPDLLLDAAADHLHLRSAGSSCAVQPTHPPGVVVNVGAHLTFIADEVAAAMMRAITLHLGGSSCTSAEHPPPLPSEDGGEGETPATVTLRLHGLIEEHLRPSIDSDFLASNGRWQLPLTHIDLQPLGAAGLHAIGANFASQLSGLRCISPFNASFAHLGSIGSGFARGTALVELRLTDLPALCSIGDEFLSCCFQLRVFELARCTALTSIGAHFLSATGAAGAPLDSLLLLLSDLPLLRTVGDYFLSCRAATATSPKNFSIGSFNSLTHLGQSAFENGGPQVLDFVKVFPRVIGLPDKALRSSRSLVRLEICGQGDGPAGRGRPPSSLRRIGPNVCAGALVLREVVVAALAELEWIGYSFCEGCPSLTSVSLRDLPLLTTIAVSFSSNCQALTTVALAGLPCVNFVGEPFCRRNCAAALTLDVGGVDFHVSRCSDAVVAACASTAQHLDKSV